MREKCNKGQAILRLIRPFVENREEPVVLFLKFYPANPYLFWDKDHWSIELPVDKVLDDVEAEDYDALLLPGGVLNPDQLRLNKKAVEFAQQFPIRPGRIIK